MNYEITLWLDGEKKSLHKLSLSAGDKGFYRACTSLSAFSKHEGTKLYNNNLKGIRHTPGKRCHIKFGGDIEVEKLMSAHLLKNYDIQPDVLPEFHHESVWEFYKAIGYDYKEQRYVS